VGVKNSRPPSPCPLPSREGKLLLFPSVAQTEARPLRGVSVAAAKRQDRAFSFDYAQDRRRAQTKVCATNTNLCNRSFRCGERGHATRRSNTAGSRFSIETSNLYALFLTSALWSSSTVLPASLSRNATASAPHITLTDLRLKPLVYYTGHKKGLALSLSMKEKGTHP